MRNHDIRLSALLVVVVAAWFSSVLVGGIVEFVKFRCFPHTPSFAIAVASFVLLAWIERRSCRASLEDR